MPSSIFFFSLDVIFDSVESTIRLASESPLLTFGKNRINDIIGTKINMIIAEKIDPKINMVVVVAEKPVLIADVAIID